MTSWQAANAIMNKYISVNSIYMYCELTDIEYA